MKFQKGRHPQADNSREREFCAAFTGCYFSTTGEVVASGDGYWTNRRGSKGHKYQWALMHVPGFAEVVYVKDGRVAAVPFVRGRTYGLTIAIFGDDFVVNLDVPVLNPPTKQPWEQAIALLEVDP